MSRRNGYENVIYFNNLNSKSYLIVIFLVGVCSTVIDD